ncbi:hypothetical protein E2320_018053 [Naja naja]|nr:hypothetical protein E2320_018053 [Naja naja]
MEAAAGVLGAGAALLYGSTSCVASSRCRNEVSLRGKTVLITGGNAGIGKATAVDLARRGARVILACRNKVRGELAMYDIRRESGNSEVILMILDLASLNSVRAFAQTFLASEPRLDILINNAGGGTADPPQGLHRKEGGNIINFQTIHKPGEGMGKAQSYGSKLANILHVRETCSNRNWLLQFAVVILVALFMQGTQTRLRHRSRDLHLLATEGIESLSGRYFADCRLLEPWSQACDDHMAKALNSERLLGLTT